MFQIRDILRQTGVPDGTGTGLADPPEQDQPIQFDTNAPVVTTPFTPAPGTSEASEALSTAAAGDGGGLPVMTRDGQITQAAPAPAPPAPTTAEMLAQGPAPDFGYGTELNEDGQRVAVTPQRHQAMTDAGHYLNPTTGQWVKGTPTAAPAPRRGRGAPAARLAQTTTASPHMTSLMYATKERGDSLAALADAQADQDEATAVTYG